MPRKNETTHDYFVLYKILKTSAYIGPMCMRVCDCVCVCMRVCLYFTYTNIARIGIRSCFRLPNKPCTTEFIYLIYIIYITYIIYNIIVCIYKAFVIFVYTLLYFSLYFFVYFFLSLPLPPFVFARFLPKLTALRFFFVSFFLFSSFCLKCKDNSNSNSNSSLS